jgi:hypothetical protein
LFHRLGEPIPFRGRQTLCKYYDHNEILNEQLLEIKSAHTAREFEKLFEQQLRHQQGYPKSAKSVEPYYDIKEILNPLKPFTSEACLCTKELYRFSDTRPTNERQRAASPASVTNAIKGLSGNEKSIDDFVSLASECYDKCINIYLDNLNDCNQRAEILVRQSLKSPSGYTGKRSLKSQKVNDLALVSRIKKLSISLDANRCDVVSQTDTFHSARQSTLSPQNCSQKTMSCNDTNNNSTESTNQLKDPPKIILSDHSTNQIQGDNSKEYSDTNSAIDKNSLTVPIENYYSSEARPP